MPKFRKPLWWMAGVGAALLVAYVAVGVPLGGLYVWPGLILGFAVMGLVATWGERP